MTGLLDAEYGLTATPSDLRQAIVERPTPLGEFFGANVGEGWWRSTIGQTAADWQARQGTAAPANPADEFALGAPLPEPPVAVPPEPDAVPMSEAEWRASPSFREGIPFDAAMSPRRAAALADQHDATAYRRWLIGNRAPGVLSSAVGLLGGLVGAAPDPVNYVPVFGPATRAAAIARFGRVAGRALTSAGEATTIVAASQPFIAGMAAQSGDDISFEEAVLNVAMSALIGGVFGAGLGLRETRAVARATAATREADAAMAAVADARRRIDEIHAQAGHESVVDARGRLNEAVGDLVAGRDIDVAVIGRGVLDDILRSDARAHEAMADRETLARIIANEGRAPAEPVAPEIAGRGVLDNLIAEDAADRTIRTMAAEQAARAEAERAAGRAVLDRASEAPPSGLSSADATVPLRRVMTPEDAAAGRLIIETAIQKEEARVARAQARGDLAAGRAVLQREMAPRTEPPPDGARVLDTILENDPRRAAEMQAAGAEVLARRMGEAAPEPTRRRVGDVAAPAVPGRMAPPPNPSARAAESVPARALDTSTARPLPDEAPPPLRAQADPTAEHNVDPSTGDFPELSDYQRLADEGRVSPDERAAFDAADAELQRAQRYRDIWDQAVVCVTGGTA